MTSGPSVPTRWSFPAVPTIVATCPWHLGAGAAGAGAAGTQRSAAAIEVVRIGFR